MAEREEGHGGERAQQAFLLLLVFRYLFCLPHYVLRFPSPSCSRSHKHTHSLSHTSSLFVIRFTLAHSCSQGTITELVKRNHNLHQENEELQQLLSVHRSALEGARGHEAGATGERKAGEVRRECVCVCAAEYVKTVLVRVLCVLTLCLSFQAAAAGSLASELEQLGAHSPFSAPVPSAAPATSSLGFPLSGKKGLESELSEHEYFYLVRTESERKKERECVCVLFCVCESFRRQYALMS